MRTLHLDFETYSDAPLPKVGAYRYALDPSTRVLLLAYQFGDQDRPQIVDVEHGEPIPTEVLEAIQNPSVVKWTHNANFERAIFQHTLGIKCPPQQWRCTMAWAMSLSLPGSLDRLCEVLGLPAEKTKMVEGRRLIQKFSTPSGAVQRSLGDQDWQTFRAYCMRDVEAEIEVAARLARYQLPENEWEAWALDQRVNDAGLPIDRALVDAVCRVAEEHKVSTEQLASDVTGLANPNSRDQMLKWLAGLGVEVDDLTSATVDELLARELPEQVREALACRQQLAKASISKYDALQRATASDGRLRGAFQFAGAGRTGRWAGRIFQPQNLPRPSISEREIDVARALVQEHDADTLSMLFDDLAGVLSSLIRSTIAAPKGKVLVVADYASIESIMIAWCAQSEYLLDLYRKGLDPYKDFATKVYGVEYAAVTKAQRSFCKPAVLGAGYGVGGPGLQRYAAAFGMDMSAEEAKRQFALFRESYSDLPLLWEQLESGASRAMSNKGAEVDAGRFKFCFDGRFLIAKLPSGRSLYYYKPRMSAGKFGRDELTYEGKEPGTRIGTHGGKIVENLVQAVARDLLVSGLLNAQAAGFEIVGHVHDEIICLADEGDRHACERLIEAMTRAPAWCQDAPIRAEGYTAKYYKKD